MCGSLEQLRVCSPVSHGYDDVVDRTLCKSVLFFKNCNLKSWIVNNGTDAVAVSRRMLQTYSYDASTMLHPIRRACNYSIHGIVFVASMFSTKRTVNGLTFTCVKKGCGD